MATSASRPNILWYCTDQQRYDTIRALGQPHIETPQLDALCADGVAFRRAYTQSPICTAARASFLTGRYPAAHQTHRNGNAYFPPHEKLVTRIFADAGYDCGLVGKLHLSAAKAFEVRPDDGYRAFWWSHHPTPDAARGHDYETWLRHEKKVDPLELYAPINYFCGPGVPASLHQTTWCSEMAIRFITEQRDGPWLLSVNPFDPHAPFDAPPEYLARVRAADLPLPLFRDSDLERQKAFAAIDQQTKVATDPRVRKAVAPVAAGDHDSIASRPPRDYDALEVKANYYAMIMLIDDQLRRIVDALRDTGQLENTIIVFMSDHGELLGDHGLILKGCRFFEGLVRVPLILSWPGRFGRGRRKRRAGGDDRRRADAARGCRAAGAARRCRVDRCCRCSPARRIPMCTVATSCPNTSTRWGAIPTTRMGRWCATAASRPRSTMGTRSASSMTSNATRASSTTCGVIRRTGSCSASASGTTSTR